MRAVVKVKQSQGRGPSNAARYIAESKLAPEREGKGARPLFTNRGDDDLTYGAANRYLNDGRGRPAKGDLIHFSVSFKNEDFERLGATDEERKKQLREAAREAMGELKSDLNIQDWRWVAGIHLNTKYPHVHVLIYKEITDDKGKRRRLGKIPKRLLARRDHGSDGAMRPVEGAIGGYFIGAMDRASERARAIEPINQSRNRERETPDMSEILSYSLEFNTPLVHQGIEYRTVENFYQAMKTANDDTEMRRRIAAASPEEARTLGEQLSARPDWHEIRSQVLEIALRHKFAPGTRWHMKLRAMGDTDILDGSKENYLGNLLMRLRDSREKIITSDEILLEANRRNPSLAGRELVQELILRGPAPEPVSPPEMFNNIREALKDRQLDDPYYNSQLEKANWLGKHSQELRDLYEHDATIKDAVLIIPAEEHELNKLTSDRPPFINERAYVHDEITDPKKANEFYDLAKTIAGKTANTDTEIAYFRYFYYRIKHDAEGRYIDKDQKELREEALEQTLAEMRPLAGEMEKLETIVSIEARRPTAVASLEQVREAELNAAYENEYQRWFAEAPEIEPDFESEEDHEEAIEIGASEVEPEIEIDSFVFNTAARKVNLNDERLRFPAGLTFENRKSLVEIYLPNFDAKIDAGKRRVAILGDINRLVEDWKQMLPEAGIARQNLSDKYDKIGYFLKAYTNERLRDPETRALNVSETFREAHERITEARSPEELNRAAREILKSNDFNWRERALLFFGRAPAHHMPERRELRHTWGFTREERAQYVKALVDGLRSPSPGLEKMLAELETRTTARAIGHYRASILNEEMRNPGKLDLHAMYERLPGYERDYLYDKIEEKARAVAGRQPTLRETAPQLGDYNEPSRQYSSAVAEIERRLLDEAIREKQPEGKSVQEIAQADGLLNREDKLRIHTIAANLAWERIEPREILTNDPAVIELLSLSEEVERMRDEAQPRAREAAVKLDEFIRSRNLDRGASEKADYYYRANQIPRNELEKLSPADKLEFAALEQRAAVAVREYKDGFKAIDKISIEIDQARNGAGFLAGPVGRETKGQQINRAGGQSNRVETPLPDPERELMNDRIILGNAIIAHARSDFAALDYEIARDHGRAFRFNIRDESVDANRRISDMDIRRRSGARGDRAADERGAERKEDRFTIRELISEADINRHSTTLEEHGRKLSGLINQLETRAKNALASYQHARRLAGEVVEKYQKRGEPSPAPFVNRETLVKTQDEAIEHRLAGHTERLERLRVALAEEHGQPMRDDQEAGRLVARVFTARTELRAREERLASFDETRHLRQWEIGGEKLSLADVDRLIEQATDKAQIVGKREFHIFPGDRRLANAEVERLGGIRQEIVEKIGQQQDGLRTNVSEAGKLLDTLAGAYEREASLREKAGLVMPAPQFTRQELERSADNIETARDVAALRQLSIFERQFNTYANPKERFGPAEGWGRAPARALVANIFHCESSERLNAFRERGSLQPLLIETSGGPITHRFKDTEPRSLIEFLARPIVETAAQRELRLGAQAAFANHESRLRADVEKTHAYLEAAREIASSQAAERSLRAGRELPAPDIALTPKQAMILEIHAERQTDPEERGRLLTLARGSAQSHFDSHSHSHTQSHEPIAREVASGKGRGR